MMIIGLRMTVYVYSSKSRSLSNVLKFGARETSYDMKERHTSSGEGVEDELDEDEKNKPSSGGNDEAT